MIRFNQLKIDPYLTAGDHFRFLDAQTAFVYENNQPTSKVKGYRCRLVMVDRGYGTFSVTVPSVPNVAPDTPVRINDLEINLFMIDGKPRIFAKASSIEQVE